MSATVAEREKPEVSHAEEFAEHIDAKLRNVLTEIEKSEVWTILSDPETEPRLLKSIIKNILLEAFGYGPHIVEGTFTAIGRLPKNRPDLMRPMLLHNHEEVDHSEMALKDYISLGGDEHFARTRRLTPECLAAVATIRMLAERDSPFAYLGYMYFGEALTPILTARAQEFLAAKDFPREAQTFIDFHAKEDIAHAKAVRSLIVRVVKAFPEAAAAIEYGFDCWGCVYPLPIWRAALERARREVA